MSLDLGKQPSHTGNYSHSLRNIAVYSFIAIAVIAAFVGLFLISPVHAQSAAVTNSSTSSATGSAVTTSGAISTTATNSTATSTTHNCPNMGANPNYNGTFPAA